MDDKNAEKGKKVELLFKNSIKKLSGVLLKLKEHFNISGEFATAYATGPELGKSDVILQFSDPRGIGANIKAYKAGYNQVTRLKIGAFCQQFILGSLQSLLEEAAVRVAGKKGRFILQSDEDLIRNVFSPISRDILHFALSRLENPELLVLYDATANLMNLFDMNQLHEYLCYDITFSRSGLIQIGKYFKIQRKGGNGVHSLHMPKTDLSHPGNNLAVKMNVKDYVRDHVPLASYRPDGLFKY